TAGIERRLGRRAASDPPPDLRPRVLMAVDDVLATPAADPAPSDPADTMLSGWPWAAVAAGIALVAAASWPPRELAGGRAPLALVERVRAAGLADDTLLAWDSPAPNRSVPPPAGDETKASPFRTTDSRHLLELELHLRENL
ncbi:MAG: hypothetical protein ACKOTB_01885, partial [Planctomycetia bacterium]